MPFNASNSTERASSTRPQINATEPGEVVGRTMGCKYWLRRAVKVMASWSMFWFSRTATYASKRWRIMQS